ncbi:MAG: guanylate kinase [Actinobacteria bacterium]|nr:guanylate kinase [Actinomycetota bacterium]
MFVISGPSGAGKGTVIRRVLQEVNGVSIAVSATTRLPRTGEVDGREYHFMSRAQFEGIARGGGFLEWVEYGGNLYGTLLAEIETRLAAGQDVILEIELQGARAVRRMLPEAVFVFLAPPTAAELERRLRGRGTEPEEVIARRLGIAEGEMSAAAEFDHVVVNDDVTRAAARIGELILATRKGD